MLIDSHAHLTSLKEEDLNEVLKRAQEAGIEAVVNICTDPEELARGLALSKQEPWIYQAASTTPHDAAKDGEAHFSIMAAAAHAKQLVAIGETGLDYFYYKETAPIQQELCKRYIALALACDLPLIIHCRDAFADFFRLLDEASIAAGKRPRGVLHCFTGTLEEAQELVRRGWFISFSGIVTFKKSEALRDVAKQVPLDQLLIETDTPYLAPLPFRSKPNEPAFLVPIAHCVAEVRGISFEALAQATAQNARQLFRLAS